MKLKEHEYIKAKLAVLTDLCADVVIGHDILCQHSHIYMDFGGNKTPLTLCSLTQTQFEPPPLFRNMTSEVKPIANRSHRHTLSDNKFIDSEIQGLLSDGVIEESLSSWRAQVLVTSNQNHKKCMVIDYSQTVNRYTLLYAYPLPYTIEDVIYNVLQH